MPWEGSVVLALPGVPFWEDRPSVEPQPRGAQRTAGVEVREGLWVEDRVSRRDRLREDKAVGRGAALQRSKAKTVQVLEQNRIF